MGRLDSKRIVDPVLTNLAQGYRNEAFVAENIFPVVTVAKEAGKIPQFSKDAFKLRDTERAIRADSNLMIPDDKTAIRFTLTEHDLAEPIDYREEEEDIFNAEQEAVETVSAGIELGREKLAADLAQNDSNYAAGNKITLSGSSQFTHASSDPVGVIETAKSALKSALGANYEITMLMGEQTYKALQNHAQLVEKIKYSMKGIVTLDLMKEIFDIPNIVVGKAAYLDGSSFVNVWGDNIILAVVPKKIGSVYTPGYGYTIRKKGMPQVDTYFSNGNKIKYVRRTDIYDVKMLSNVAGYLIKDTNGS